MRFLSLLAALLFASPAIAGVEISGSVKSSQLSAGYTTVKTRGGSAGISVGLSSFLRIGLTHEQEYETEQGWEDPASTTAHRDANGNVDPYEIYKVDHTTTYSADLTLVLYQGTVMTPYLIGGYALRFLQRTIKDPATKQVTAYDPIPIPGPQGGVGLQISLNRDFSLQLRYIVSQGSTQLPTDEKPTSKNDGNGSVGLSYKL